MWLYFGAFLMLMELLAPGFVIFFFGLSAAKKYGGVYVPPNLAVIHQYARE